MPLVVGDPMTCPLNRGQPRTGRPPRIVKTVDTLLATVLTLGCGGNALAPSAATSEGAIPDLRGRQVMVLPV